MPLATRSHGGPRGWLLFAWFVLPRLFGEDERDPYTYSIFPPISYVRSLSVHIYLTGHNIFLLLGIPTYVVVASGCFC